jgi:hypothetical protein
MEDGRRELPKPPRRVPAGASPTVAPAARTTIQPRPNAAQTTKPPKPPRFRFLLPLIVFVLVIGAGAGWLVRAYSLSLDTDKVLQASGPTVVRVLATTCNGTGQASGLLLANGRVITTASAIRQPVSIGILTADGRVRRANVLGVNANGIAVLQLLSRLDNPTAKLALKLPDAKADRAIIGYNQAGDQSVEQAGTALQPRALRDILDPGSLGAPMFDKSGQVIGLVAGETVASSKVIGLDELRQYAGPAALPITPEPLGTCLARGPQAPVKPDLSVANTPLAGEVQQVLGDYLDALNRHDYLAMQATYSAQLAANGTEKDFANTHGTSYAFDATITDVAAGAADGATARMTFTVLFSPKSTGANGQTCSRLDLRYRLVREQDRLRIDQAASMATDQSCDTD